MIDARLPRKSSVQAFHGFPEGRTVRPLPGLVEDCDRMYPYKREPSIQLPVPLPQSATLAFSTLSTPYSGSPSASSRLLAPILPTRRPACSDGLWPLRLSLSRGSSEHWLGACRAEVAWS